MAARCSSGRAPATSATSGSPVAVNLPKTRTPWLIVRRPSRCCRTVTSRPAQLRRPGCRSSCSVRRFTLTVLSRATRRVSSWQRIASRSAEPRHERTRRVARRARERGVVLRHEALGEIAIGGLERRDPGDPQLVDQPVLEGPIQPLTAAARLRRIGGNVFDAEAGQGPPHLREVRLVDRPLRRRGVKRPVRPVRCTAPSGCPRGAARLPGSS